MESGFPPINMLQSFKEFSLKDIMVIARSLPVPVNLSGIVLNYEGSHQESPLSCLDDMNGVSYFVGLCCCHFVVCL